jgi:hypothetical protein
LVLRRLRRSTHCRASAAVAGFLLVAVLHKTADAAPATPPRLAAKAGRPEALNLTNSFLEPVHQDGGAPFGFWPFPEPGGRPGLFLVPAPVCTPLFVDTTRYPIFPSTAFSSSINFFSLAAIAYFSASRLSTDFTRSSSFGSATESSFVRSFAAFWHTAPPKKNPAHTQGHNEVEALNELHDQLSGAVYR